MAARDYQNGDDNWRQRLLSLIWSVIRGLPVNSIAELDDDTAFCRGGGPGGHSIPAGSYLRRQLDHYGWLPSSQGPASRSGCFLRLSTRRLVSSGRTDEELGDKLLPYVIVDSIDDLAKLQRLGVEVLDDAASASSPALVRALALLGERLSTEWGRKEILEVRSRWRLVRGAIQEIYRFLNQPEAAIDCPPDIKFAVKAANYFNVSVDYLVGNSNLKSKQDHHRRTNHRERRVQQLQKRKGRNESYEDRRLVSRVRGFPPPRRSGGR